jgi:hypothetical protein
MLLTFRPTAESRLAAHGYPMKYVKPLLLVLGCAAVLFQAYNKSGYIVEAAPYFGNPAYDLDE